MGSTLRPHNGCQCPEQQHYGYCSNVNVLAAPAPAAVAPVQRWTTPAAIARYLGYSHTRVCTMLREQVIRGVQVQRSHYADDRPRATTRGHWRVYEADLLAFLRELRGKPVPTPNLRWKRKP